MDYKNALRQAHLVSLKQKYLDIIEEARREKEEKDREYFEQAQEAYLEREKNRKELPQRLRASGISGGAGEEEERSVELEYGEELRQLEEKRRGYAEEYQRILDKQTRLMKNAINEYNARIALEDSASSEKSTSTKASRSSSSSSSGSNSGENSSDSKSSLPIDINKVLNGPALSGLNKVFGGQRASGTDTVTQYIPPRRYAVK